MEYLNLFKHLHNAQVEYLICGGLAVNIYGIPRMTADIDLLINFDAENVRRFDQVLEKLNFAPQLPLKLEELKDEATRLIAIKEKNLICYSFYNTRSNYLNVDVMIDTPVKFETMWLARETREIEDMKVHIVSIPHLIKMKEYANRKQDQQDILMLRKLTNIPEK